MQISYCRNQRVFQKSVFSRSLEPGGGVGIGHNSVVIESRRWGKRSKQGNDQEGLVSHGKNFRFYSKYNGKH